MANFLSRFGATIKYFLHYFVASQDVDLRSLGAAPDPRMVRMADQDMRQIPGPLQNPLPPPVGEK